MERSRLSIGRALGMYALYVIVFIVGGGIGAGVPSYVFEMVTGTDPMAGEDYFLYAIMFGMSGYIAYRLAQRVIE